MNLWSNFETSFFGAGRWGCFGDGYDRFGSVLVEKRLCSFEGFVCILLFSANELLRIIDEVNHRTISWQRMMDGHRDSYA